MRITPIDERRGLPSASGIHRLVNCPGSWAMERNAHTDNESDDARLGTEVHAVLAGELAMASATPAAQEIAAMCERLLVERVSTTYGSIDDADEVLREERRWVHFPDALSVSGKADLVARFGTRLLIVDYKTGRNQTTPAESNWQLATLALCFDSHDVKEITCAIIAPLQPTPVTITRYTREFLRGVYIALRDALKAAMRPGAALVPSIESCCYCRARAHCGAAIGESVALATTNATQLSVDELGVVLCKIKLAEKIFDAVRDQARSRIVSGESIPGWTLKPGSTRDKITNVNEVFARLFSRRGISAERFTAACSVTKKELESMLRECGIKGADLRAEIESITDGCVESKQAAPSLVEA